MLMITKQSNYLTMNNDPKKIKFVFFDLETTGCKGSGSIFNEFHRIVQISAVTSSEQFDAIVNPEVHIPQASTAIHHVSNEMAQQGTTFKKVFPNFRAFVKKGAKRNTQIVLVAHNAIGFDKIVLEKECLRCGLKMPANWVFYDTLLTYRTQFPELVSKRLGDIYQNRFNEPIQNAHNALSDTLALQRLFEHDLLPSFNLIHTVPTGIPSYTPNKAPVDALRGIGKYTKKAVIILVQQNNPTVGHLRSYCSGKSVEEIEIILRLKLRCKAETYLFSLLCELTLYTDPIELFKQFPFVIDSFAGLSDGTVQKLVQMGIRSPEQFKRHYLYNLAESGDAWDKLMCDLECDPFRVAMLLRSIY